MVLGQVAVDEKSNEITAIPALLEVLAVSGCIVTIDAMGCQKEIARKIRAREADYVLALKDNHPHAGTEWLALPDALGRETDFAGMDTFHETIEKGHGRIERRRCWTISDPAVIGWLDPNTLSGKW